MQVKGFTRKSLLNSDHNIRRQSLNDIHSLCRLNQEQLTNQFVLASTSVVYPSMGSNNP